MSAKMYSYLSPAKVNLLLKVLRKRDDGYHEISSVMQPITLYDELSIEVGRGDEITVETNHPHLPTDERNLAYRAAEAFLKKVDIKVGVRIHIKKVIPVGGGLGGGSSNGATVLMGLNEILKGGLPKGELMEIGIGLGSDVPFFILERPTIATGRGEILEGIDLPRFWYILINPGFQVSTGWAYSLLNTCRDRQNLDLTSKVEDISINDLKDLLRGPSGVKGILINDLEGVTVGIYPQLKVIKSALLDVGAEGALMSGSGPTVFGVFLDEGKAKAASGVLKERFKDKGWPIFLAQGW